MAFYPRQRQEEMVSAKDRALLEQRKAEFVSQMNEQLNRLPDSPFKQDLMKLRDHGLSKFPVFPVDLSIWVVAYYEDWLRELDRVPAAFRE